jgi:hypothetical protein
MKIKDLPDNTKLETIKVRLPKEVDINLIGLKTREVYVYSLYFGDVWVKTDSKSERVYPISGYYGHEVLDWEVVS